jgi:hypothetical protein
MLEQDIDWKQCPACGKRLERAQFSANIRRKDGLMPYCRQCNVKKVTEWRAQNKKLQAFRTWKAKLRRKYQITPETFHLMWDRQGGLCAICCEPLSGDGKKRAGVDHCHRTGLARALLCHPCNMGLGAFRERREVMLKAVEYLTHFENAYKDKIANR